MAEKVNKLRILLVTSDKYPPFRPAARVIFGEEFVTREHIVDWLVQADNNCKQSSCRSYGNGTAFVAATDDGVARWNRFHKYLLDFINDLKMFGLARRERYDVIQVKDKYIAALLAILASKIGNARLTYWLAYPHAEASLYEAKDNIARYRYFYFLRGYIFKLLLYKIILPSADHIFVQSEQMKHDIAAEGISLYKMTPIPGSLSLSDIPYTPSSRETVLEKPNRQKRVVYLGTLLRIRRLDFLIRVHEKVLKKHPNTIMFLIGKGEMPDDEKMLIDEAECLGIRDSIVFTGYLPMGEAWEYIRNADACLSPYFPTPILNSTSPTKLIEYMAMGKAVVGNDHPEQSLVISESGAGLCVPWDEDAFSDAIIRLLNDPVLAQKMGNMGRKYVEHHRTNSIMASKVEEQYFRICNKQYVHPGKGVDESSSL